MANPNTPYGLQPIRRLDGATWNDSLTVYQVPAAYGSAMYIGDPVIKVAGSADANGINGINLATAGAGNLITGVICGWAGIGTFNYGAGNNGPSLFGASGSPGNIFRPASTSQVYYALVNDDPEAEFVIQENDNSGGVAGTPLPLAAVGKNANLVAGNGSAYTGWSGWMLQANGVAATQNFQLNIKGFLQEPDNTPAALYAKVIVSINQHTETVNTAGI